MKIGNKKNGNRGIILGFLFAVCNCIADYFASGAIFRLFSSHERARDSFESSATVILFKKLKSKCRNFTEYIKKFVSRQFEGSAILSLLSFFAKSILSLPGRVFGAFSMTWSAYVLLIALIKRYALYQSGGLGADIICGTIVFAASIPLMFSDKTIYRLCAESPVVLFVLTNIFGVPAESLKCSDCAKIGQSGAVILGIAFGLLTYFISPLYMLIAVIAVVVIGMILAYPEGGVVISIAISPLLGLSFAPSIILAAVVLLTTVAYLVKVIRGKRVFKFSVTELAFFGFMLSVFFGGFAPGDSNTIENALLSCSLMLVFPLAVNLMKYKRWIKTCISAFLIPAVIVAFVGMVQYALGFAPSGWMDESVFGGISSRAVSVFNNPNILGVYLALIFPMALMLTLPRYSSKIRILGGIISVFIVLCSVFTFSRSAWIALVFGGIVFAVSVSPKGILWALPAAGAAAVAALIFSETIGARLVNFITLSDSANSYRVAVWNSSCEMLSQVFAGGIGMGEEAFKTAYVNFAAAGTQYAMHSHSLYIQIAVQLGIIGLILFLMSVFVIVRKSFSASVNPASDQELMTCAKASVSGALSLMVAGMFDYTWYNFRVFFVFWALLGFACASVNLSERTCSTLSDSYNDENSSSITVPIQRNSEKITENEKGDNLND